MSAKVLVLPHRGDYFTVEGERPVLADPGIYALRYSHYETARLHGGRAGKVVVWFTICEMGRHFERLVAAYYNATVTSAKRRRGGNFKVGWCRISRNGPTRFPLIGPTLQGLPAEPQATGFTRPFCAKQVSWL